MRIANDTQRTVIVGATGSGKTQCALWHLGLRDFDTKPWIVYDYKYDEAINMIEGAHHIEVSDNIPTSPGLYIVHPDPDQVDLVEMQFKQIWLNENTGVYIDEGYMIGNNNAQFRTLLTQGRSKHIPMIVLSQRPVWMDRFVFSETEFFQIFRLQHRKDRQKVEEFVPADLDKRLPEYHSYYYDVGLDKTEIAPPVPDRDEIIRGIESRLPQRKNL
jgi:hypothetical protein